ncbi:Muscle M-line assembly protein unc-89 [Sugiyamaella lignohabitans]|uniref:Muscle M-line assembly protein unc-89 n=1 Tax=Sugiyamaella lignohabitans TaxID=796027 RepID=A0A167C6P0_9ASCO|nr:Muscle M-line assembly protein unc-89 [Sugiyamaella lignohabitans]ANB11286.1 Muscle M-line assembly protein unc-89 [Sugiyamaella lignohabitans]
MMDVFNDDEVESYDYGSRNEVSSDEEAVETSDDEGVDSVEQEYLNSKISSEREKSEYKLGQAWMAIISKYGNEDIEKDADVIDLYTGEIVEDHGHLRSLDDKTGSLWLDVDDENDGESARRKRKSGSQTGLDSSPSKKSKNNSPVKPVADLTNWLLNSDDGHDKEDTILPQNNSTSVISPIRQKIDIPSSPIKHNNSSSAVLQYLDESDSDSDTSPLPSSEPTTSLTLKPSCKPGGSLKCNRPFCFKCS